MITLRKLAALAMLGTLTLPAVAKAGPPWFAGSGRIAVGGGIRGGLRGGFGPPARGIYGRGGGFGGVRLSVLPFGYRPYRYGGIDCYYGGGIWYRPWGGGFAPFYPPIGLSLTVLPFGYSTYYYGGVPYYWYEDVYYTDAASGGYVVADPPVQGDSYRPAPQPSRPSVESPADSLLIIPKEGQSEQKMQADRQSARNYAMDESGFDPGRADASDPGTARARRAYFRAMKSYLEERGYLVKN